MKKQMSAGRSIDWGIAGLTYSRELVLLKTLGQLVGALLKVSQVSKVYRYIE